MPNSNPPSFQKGSELPVRLALLLQLSSRLSLTESIPALARTAIEARSALGFDRAGIWLISNSHPGCIEGTWGVDDSGNPVDETSFRLRFAPESGDMHPDHQSSLSILFQQTRNERAVAQLIERDVLLNGHLPDSTLSGDRLLTSLYDGKDCVGVLSIDMTVSRRPISPEDQQVAAMLGSILGSNVARVKADQEHCRLSTERIALIESLLEACGQLASENTVEGLIRKTVELAPRALGFSRMGVWLYDAEKNVLRGSFGIDEQGQIRDERECEMGGEAVENFQRLAMKCGPGAERWFIERGILTDHRVRAVGQGTRALSIVLDGSEPVGQISVDDLLGGRNPGEFEGRLLGLFSMVFGELISKIRSRVAIEATNQLLDQRIHARTSELSLAVHQLRDEIEQRRSAETELARQTNLLRSLIDSLPDRVYIKDNTGKYIVSNRFHWASLGAKSEKDVLGKTCYDFFPAELADSYAAKDEEIKQSRQPVQGFLEKSIVHGEYGELESRWFMTWKIPLLEADGTVSGVVGVSTDYTQQKEADEVRSAHLRYVESVNLVAEAISMNDSSEDLTNAVMNLIFDRLDCDGLWVFHPIEEGDFPGLAFWRNGQDSTLAIALSRPERLKGMLTSNATIRFQEAQYECMASTVQPKVGDPWAIIAARDTGRSGWSMDDERFFSATTVRFGEAMNRIMLRERLQESEMRHRALFENSMDGIYRCSPEGLFLDVNPAFVRMLGYDNARQVLELAPNALIFQPADFDLAREHVAQGCELRRRNGEQLYIEVSTHAVYHQGGEIAHYEGIVRDISDRQRMHEAMLHTQKLESLGVLAGGIAHDFNNLLAVILGNADLARSELERNSPVRESIEQIELASRRGSELCKQMLAYSGKGHFVIQPLNVNDVVNEMTHLLEISINKGVIMRYRMFEHLPAVMADATQIRQVIMNLVINASDAIGEKSGVITISTGVFTADPTYLTEAFLANELPEGDYVYIEVSDTGIGMDADTQARIFDPFFSTKFTGRGLGLAAVLGIVRGHKGAMKVYSEKGVGSTFKVLLPASESLVVKETPDEEAWSKHRYSGVALVVDDEMPVRTMARRMVEKLGFTVITADNGAEGIKAYRENINKVKFVLLDMTMPVLAGDGAFREILKLDPAAKVILTSGYNEEEATARFAGKGLAGFLQKPFRIVELRAAIEKAFGENE